MQYKAVDGLSLRACHLSVIQSGLRGLRHWLVGIFPSHTCRLTPLRAHGVYLSEMSCRSVSTGDTHVSSSKELIELIGDPGVSTSMARLFSPMGVCDSAKWMLDHTGPTVQDVQDIDV